MGRRVHFAAVGCPECAVHTQTLDYRERDPDRPHSEAGDLLIDLSALRAEISAQASAILDIWGRDAAAAPHARLGNLAHHLAARRVDRPDLQHRLAAFGFARWSDAQAVVPALDAVVATLERLVGVPASRYPDLAAIFEGDRARRVARDAIFGSTPDAGPCLIVALPDGAESDPRLVRDLMTAGMTCARIDCARGDARRWCEMIVNIRIAERELGRRCRIMMDVAGRRVKIAAVAGMDKRRVMKGDTIAIAADIARAGTRGVTFTCDPPDFARSLALGDRLWINDGRIGAQVAACSEDNVHLEVTAARPKGEKIKPGRSLRCPGAKFPAFGRTDEEALDFIAENADIVGCSMLQCAEDIRELQQRLAIRGQRPALPVVLIVETPRAFANLPHLMAQAASLQPTAVLISDSEAAIECGPDRLGELREQAFALCRAASVPAIWASAGVDNLTREGAAAAPEAASAIVGRRFDALALDSGPCVLEATQFIRDLFSAPVRNEQLSLLPPIA